MNHSPLLRAPLPSAVFLWLFLPAAGSALRAQSLLLDYDLGSGQATTVWNTLNNTNSSFAPAEGAGILTVGSPGYATGAGLYSWMGDYSVTTVQTGGGALADINTVILQIDLQPNGSLGFDGGPLLTYTHSGGSGALAASWSAVTGVEVRNTSMGAGTFRNWSFQWDLSAIPGDVTSVSVTTPVPVHSSVLAARVDAGGGVFSEPVFSAVPEPSAALLTGGTALGLVMRRRRTATA